MNTENNELLDFDWENSTEDFFDIQKEAGTLKEPETKKESKESKKPVEEEEKIEEVEEVEGDFFETKTEEKAASKKGEDEGDEGETKPPKKGEEINSIYNDVYKDFKESGIFKHVEIEEGEELDSDRLYELQQEEYEAEIASRLENWATKDLDEDARAFIKFKTQGGETKDFFKAYKDTSSVPQGNIEDESYQDDVIRYQLASEGWDRDEIEDRLEYLTDNGKKQTIAERYSDKIKETETETKQSLIAQAEANKVSQRKQEEEYRQTIQDTLEENKDIKGFKITKEDKTKLVSFLTKKEHKISDSKSVTGFQKKLAETFKNPQKMVLLAKMLQDDFDMKDFEKQITTKQTRKVKSNLEQRKSLRPNNSGSSLDGVYLADLF